MNQQAKKTFEGFFVVALFAVIIFAAFAFADLPYPQAGAGTSGAFTNASQNKGNQFNISINWSQAAATTLTSNNVSQVNISLPANFTFLAGAANGTKSPDHVSFTNLTFDSYSSNISMVLSWSNFTGILVNTSLNGSFWFNASPSTAGWFNMTIVFLNGTDTSTYTANYMNVSIFVNSTASGPSLLNETSGETVPAGHNFSALKSGMNYSNATLDVIRITGPVDYPEVLRITIQNATGGAAVIVNFTGNQSASGSGPTADGYWYKHINASYQMSNVTNGSATLTYNITVLVREATHNLSDNYTFFNIRFDNTKPIVQNANISAPLSGGNYSGNITLNVTGTDATGIIGFWNFTNATATAAVAAEKQGATVPITTSSGNIMTATFNTLGIGDGYWNISFFANDTAGNSNNHSDTYAGAPKVTNVVIDNTAPSITLTYNTASTTKNKLVVDVGVIDWPSNVSGACTHDRGGLGTIVGSGAGTQTYSEEGINCGTSTTVKVTCTDYAGNAGTKTIVASTNLCAGGSASSGGGGNTVSWTATYVEDEKELSEMGSGGLTRGLGSNSRVKLKVSGETHYVGVTSLSTSTATVEVSSSHPQSATLQVGDERKFDVDFDGNYYDLSVRLNSITNNEADITIKAVSEAITEETIKDAGQQEETAGGTAVSGGSIAEEGGSFVSWIIAILVLIAIVVVVLLKKKGKF